MFEEYNDNKDELLSRQAFTRGEEKASDFFFRKFYAPLCYFAGSYLPDPEDAKDVVQDCFIKLWNVRTTIQRPEALKSYLYTMVRNACIHVIRKEKQSNRVYTELQSVADTLLPEELDEVTHAETIRQVHERMAELPPRMQEVFRKFYLEGKGQAEIADELQISSHTVRNQRLRALVLLRKFFQIFF